MASLIDHILIPLALKTIVHPRALHIDMILSDTEVSKCNQSRWPSNCTGFNGYHVMRKSFIALRPSLPTFPLQRTHGAKLLCSFFWNGFRQTCRLSVKQLTKGMFAWNRFNKTIISRRESTAVEMLEEREGAQHIVLYIWIRQNVFQPPVEPKNNFE